MKHATIEVDPLDPAKTTVRFSYDREVVHQFKASFRSNLRRWDPDRKVWVLLDPALAAHVERFLLRQDYEVDNRTSYRYERPPRQPPPDFEARRPGSAGTSAPDLPTAIQIVVRAAPPDQQRRIVRVLAGAFHPDSGGDPAISRFVNTLMDSMPNPTPKS